MVVSLKPYTCLVGANDAGKSSFLRAIQHLFEDHPPIGDHDPTKGGEPREQHYIEAELEDVPEGFPFAPYGTAQFRRSFNPNASLCYWGSKPKLEIIAQMARGTLKKGEWKDDPNVTPEMRTEIAPFLQEKGMVTSETSTRCFEHLVNKGLVEFVQDWAPIPSSDLEPYIRIHFLPADARAEDEMIGKEGAMFDRLGGDLVREAAEGNVKLSEAREKYESAISEIISKTEEDKWAYEPLNELQKTLSDKVKRFDDTLCVSSEPQRGRLSAISFGMTLTITNDVSTSIKQMGHGCRRSVMFAMLETLAEMRQIKAQQAESEGVETFSPVPCSVFLIEEPELYLHPQKERERMRMLEELSEQPHVNVIVATHSAFFVDLEKADGVVRFERASIGEARAFSWQGGSLNQNEREDFIAMRLLHPTTAAMVFASRIIIVEGETESIMLPILARRMGVDCDGTEIVWAGGIKNIPYLLRICNELKLPYTVWADRDANDHIPEIQDHCHPDLAKLVVVPNGWEAMTGVVPVGREGKPWASYRHFILEGNDLCEDGKIRLIAAYTRQDHDEPLSSSSPTTNEPSALTSQTSML